MKKGRASAKVRRAPAARKADEAVQWFQREGFDPAEYIGQLRSEKDLDQARNELTQLHDFCKQEIQKVVHDHHKDFLEASRDISDVEGLVDELRNYVSGGATVVANLLDLPPLPHQAAAASALLPATNIVPDPLGAPQPQPTAWASILALQADLLQDLQVAVAEQDSATARALLAAGRDMIAVVDRDSAQLSAQASDDGISAWRYNFEGTLAAQKAALIEELQRQLSRTNSSTFERRTAAQTLGLLVGPGQATQALLRCHTLRLRAAQQHLLTQHSAAGGDPDGVEYAGGLAQTTFLAIGAAAEDVRAVFPGPVLAQPPNGTAGAAAASAAGGAAAALPTVAALVVQWASDEARNCAALLRRHALTPFLATGTAVGALLCMGLVLVFCAALEGSHGLALRVTFQGELWGLVEAIVRRHLHRLRDEAAAATSVDATNAALQAYAGGGSLAGATMATARLPDGATNGLSNPPALSGAQQVVGGTAAAGSSSWGSATPFSVAARLKGLVAMLPELRALAEGLAPVGTTAAVTVLRQGVVAAFAAVCEQVLASVKRVLGSGSSSSAPGAGSSAAAAGTATRAGGSAGGPGPVMAALAGPAAGREGARLASYMLNVEKQLRTFAESDVQVALAPLAHVVGPVVPPELLLPSLYPLAELRGTLPPPAAEDAHMTVSAPADAPGSASIVLQQHSSGVLERIRAELEAETERREKEREARRQREAQEQEQLASQQAQSRQQLVEEKRQEESKAAANASAAAVAVASTAGAVAGRTEASGANGVAPANASKSLATDLEAELEAGAARSQRPKVVVDEPASSVSLQRARRAPEGVVAVRFKDEEAEASEAPVPHSSKGKTAQAAAEPEEAAVAARRRRRAELASEEEVTAEAAMATASAVEDHARARSRPRGDQDAASVASWEPEPVAQPAASRRPGQAELIEQPVPAQRRRAQVTEFQLEEDNLVAPSAAAGRRERRERERYQDRGNGAGRGGDGYAGAVGVAAQREPTPDAATSAAAVDAGARNLPHMRATAQPQPEPAVAVPAGRRRQARTEEEPALGDGARSRSVRRERQSEAVAAEGDNPSGSASARRGVSAAQRGFQAEQDPRPRRLPRAEPEAGAVEAAVVQPAPDPDPGAARSRARAAVSPEEPVLARRSRAQPEPALEASATTGLARKPNRFGVALSDDDDLPAPRMRRARPGSAAPAAAFANEDAAAALSLPDSPQPAAASAVGQRASTTAATALGPPVAVDITPAAERRRRPLPRPPSDSDEELPTGGRARPARPTAVAAEIGERAEGSAAPAAAHGAAAGEPTAKAMTAKERLAARMAARMAAAGGGGA
ncbi:hypothetical protein HYH02_014727 [Chlamydomonas schloesseri]|uniref:Conserved oligomeric Golgi complex subunit 2 n=1 Tax=Chlamydomonas schloesseri TaxID=2026947 RepID=A0A835SUJ5_9CHLO|nr:hypothetical protein HYH02_014727 [Chlamydomonas schloesseri]|eukprot:KAG2426875.1 hypothetical protein HYH02_014727 [Chlamydomonas schloesseri]